MYVTETAYAAGGSMGSAVPIEGKIQTVTINQNNSLIRTAALGEGRNEVFVGWGNYDCSFSIDYEIAGFDFLQYAFGAKAGSGSTSTPYYLEEATFRAYTGSGLRSFRMQVNAKDYTGGTDSVDTIIGCILNSISINCSLGQNVKCSVEGLAQKVTASTTGSGSYTASTTKPWIYALGDFNWNGSDVGRIQSITVSVNNNFDPNLGREIGSRFVQEMEPGLRKYDWTAVVKMTSAVHNALVLDFQGGAELSTGGTGEPSFKEIVLALSEGSSTGHRNAQIKLSDCAINDMSKPINISENIIEVTMNGTAKKGTEDTTNRPIKWWVST